MRLIFPILMILTGLLAFIPFRAFSADSQIGDDAGAFVATTLDGKKFDLLMLKGKVVVITFWATWCRTCHFEMPALEAVWRQHHSEGLEVLAVSADSRDGRKHVNEVMHFFTYPAATMMDVSKNELITPTSVPLTYVIGKDGVVKDIIEPPFSLSNEAEFGATIKELLKEKVESKPVAKAEEKDDSKKEETKGEAKKDEKK